MGIFKRDISVQVPVVEFDRPGAAQARASRAGRDAAERIDPGGGRRVAGYSPEAEDAFFKAYRAEADRKGH